jgi:hypothetical protein
MPKVCWLKSTDNGADLLGPHTKRVEMSKTVGNDRGKHRIFRSVTPRTSRRLTLNLIGLRLEGSGGRNRANNANNRD